MNKRLKLIDVDYMSKDSINEEDLLRLGVNPSDDGLLAIETYFDGVNIVRVGSIISDFDEHIKNLNK